MDLDSDWKTGLAKEAVLNTQANERCRENIIHLRRFKYYEKERMYRFFMEFSPHGDLARLAFRYQAYGNYLPELFLWYLFDSLATAILAMESEDQPWVDFKTKSDLPSYYMLHLDLKPANVLLGYRLQQSAEVKAGDPTLTYPTIQVSDFGLAEVTGFGDMRNPDKIRPNGTQFYEPPVCLVYEFAYDGEILMY